MRKVVWTMSFVALWAACSKRGGVELTDASTSGEGPETGGGGAGTDGQVMTGGASGADAALPTGGATGAGGATATGGTTGSGGVAATGGTTGAGGTPATGGTTGAGGAAAAGGVPGSGGSAGAGGTAMVGCPGLDPIAEPPEQLYLAPDGDDMADGTSASPLQTLGAAAQRFTAGGTVIVRGGTYPAQPIFDALGTVGHPLVIRAADGETPVFDGSGVTDSGIAVIHLGRAESAVFEGLEIANCGADLCRGIYSETRVVDLTVRACHVHHLDGAGLNFWGKQIRLEGNHVHDVALTNLNNTDYPNGGGWPTCIGTMPWVTRWSGIPGDTWADDVVIRDNRVENCWGEGIGIWYGTNVVAEGNVVINPWCVGIYLDNSYGVRVSRNFVHVTRGFSGSQGMGVALATEPYDSWEIAGSATHDVEISNNVIVAGIGVAWFRMTTNPHPTNTYDKISVLFNTVLATEVNALGFMQVLEGAPIPSGCVAKNNVFVEASASWIDNIDGWTLAGNAWLNEEKPWQAGASDVSLSIAVPTISSAIDAEPLAGKVGTGEAGTSVTEDFLCAARDPARPVRGAFER